MNYQMQEQNQASSQNKDLQSYIQKINSRITLQDLYHIFYLRPFECVLDQNKGGLPKGLKIVQRKSETQYELKQMKQILSFDQFTQDRQKNKYFPTYYQYACQNNGDNLLSQMKTHDAMQMAICICMYNEDKNMLNNTLMGVGQNIVNLWKQGVDPDKITVIILQDGIEKMDSSILDLMNILENQSGMRFNNSKKKNFDELINKIQDLQKTKYEYGWQGEDQYIDMNSFLFSKQEESARKKIRFVNVKKQYDQVRKLLKQVESLGKKKAITLDQLPKKVAEFFRAECKQMMKQQIGGIKEQNFQQQFGKYYISITQSLKKSMPLINNALTKTRQFCKQYIDSRSQMSHVSFFRTNLYFPEESGLSFQQTEHLNTYNQMKQQRKDQKQSSKLINFQQFDTAQIQLRLAIKMNIFFVIKYKNNQKLSSHNWFFNGFCKQFANCEFVDASERRSQAQGQKPKKTAMEQVSPKYSILLDVGLRPKQQALVKMYNVMQNHPKIGGVCGYMGLKIERSDQSQDQLRQKIDSISNLCLYFVDIQRAQQLQYHFAHLIDKGFESIFQFIHVLPGAFSGYNMKAIWGQDNNNSDKLLQSYFKSINQKLKDQPYKEGNLSIWTILSRILLPNALTKSCIDPVPKDSYEQLMYQSNVYLAEDRILCMGIHKNNFKLMFLPNAQSLVDPVKDIPSLMGQRKRWINGSFFAFQKVSDEFKQMQCCQVLNIQIWYLAFMNMLAFIAPGFYLFSISVAMEVFKADVLVKLGDFQQDSQIYNAFVYTINFIYAILIFGLVYFSVNLTNRNQKFVKYIYTLSTILGIMSIIMLTILVVDLVRGLTKGSSYLIANQSSNFVSNIPGGQATVDIMRYIVMGIMGLYAVPLLFYSILFWNFKIIFQILMGAISFSFYTPTYLIILNVYALCRMDDLSWGTKGLDAGSGGRDDTVMSNWKTIKSIHVGKFIFWNVLTAGLLIHFGSDYLVRFYLTFALMILIASTMAVKVLLAILYYIYYKLCINDKPKPKDANITYTQWQKQNRLKEPSLYKNFKKSDRNMDHSLDKQIRSKIRQNIIHLHNALGFQKQTNLLILKLFGQAIQKKNQNLEKIKQMKLFDLIVNIMEKNKDQNVRGTGSKIQKKTVPNNHLLQVAQNIPLKRTNSIIDKTASKQLIFQMSFEANSQADLMNPAAQLIHYIPASKIIEIPQKELRGYKIQLQAQYQQNDYESEKKSEKSRKQKSGQGSHKKMLNSLEPLTNVRKFDSTTKNEKKGNKNVLEIDDY